MSQTLAQKLGLQDAKPYVAAQQREHQRAQARADAAARRDAIRARIAAAARRVGANALAAWTLAAPWTAALCLVVAVGAMQIADHQSAQLAAVTQERDALRAANAPGTTITMQSAHLPDLAITARKMANVLDAEYIITPSQPGSKRVTP